MMRDFKHALRMLAARPVFTLTATAVLALGIGSNAAIFGLVNGFLFKPLAIQKPEELVGCYSRNSKRPDYRAFSYPNYADLREQNGVFAGLAAHNLAMAGLSEGEGTRRVFVDIVSNNYFATLGAPLWRGRAFTLEEERPGSRVPVAIASYSFWKKQGADPRLVGSSLRVNGNLYTVVGIAPEGFTGSTAVVSPELYMPMGMFETLDNDFRGERRSLSARDHHVLILVGRLRAGMTQAAANAQLPAVAARLEQAYPGENKDQTFLVRPLSRLSVSTSPKNDDELLAPAGLLLSMAGVVLLIASLNVANMMLARGAARRKEIAVRLALGGARRDIMRQLSIEGLVLALPGGLAGLLVATWSTTLLMKSMGGLLPIDLVYQAAPDFRVLGATLVFCVLSTILFAVWPAWNLSRPDLVSDLKDGEHDLSGGKPARLFSRRNLLVIGQVSLSLMLLTVAGLFLRSASRAAGISPGFRMDGVVLAEVDASLAGYSETQGRLLYRALLERVRAVPGVTSAGIAATVPFGMVSLGRSVEKPGDPRPSPHAASLRLNVASDGYFETLGIRLRAGRTFVAADAGSSARVVILDEAAAKRLWPDGSAVGRRVRMRMDDSGTEREAEVAGIVGGIKNSFVGSPEPEMYVPFGQEYQANMHLHIGVAETHVMDAVRREIRAVDRRLPVLAYRTMRDHLDASADLWIVRTGARMFAIFGGIALLLAMIGLYGVRAYTVARRTREIGIRMALGADAPATLRLILREGLLLTAVGTGIGLALSLGTGKLLSTFLYEVSGFDAVVLTAAPVLLGAVSLLACYLPARRAASVDPMVALRYE
jgi:predicted permease